MSSSTTSTSSKSVKSTSRKRKSTGDVSSDPSYNSELDSDKKRLKASDWKTETLQDIGVFFPPNFITLDELFQKLKAVKKVTVPDYIELFSTITKENLTFSLTDIDWSKDHKGAFATEQEAIRTIDENQKLLLEFVANFEIKDGEQLKKILFHRWDTYAFNFLSEIKEVLAKLNTIGRKGCLEKEPLRESIFTQLFMKFTEILFLKPEVGEMKKTTLKIRNKVVGSIPNVRFMKPQPLTGDNLLVMLTEVKRDGMKKEPDKDSAIPWIESRLKSVVLGQIGAELVAESSVSVFSPNTLGIICMRTEIIFLYLEMNQEQYKALIINKELKGTSSYIQYTKSFDIMIKKDRDQLMDIFVWLACVQDFVRYFIENVKTK